MYKKMFGDFPVGGLVLMFGFIIACFCCCFWQFTNTAYVGRMSVPHEEYEIFKTAAINPEFSITRLQVMNSDPVYLDFVIQVPRSASFPMGERADWQFNIMGAVVLAAGLLVLSIPFWAFKCDK
jgi:hypothetical protein